MYIHKLGICTMKTKYDRNRAWSADKLLFKNFDAVQYAHLFFTRAVLQEPAYTSHLFIKGCAISVGVFHCQDDLV